MIGRDTETPAVQDTQRVLPVRVAPFGKNAEGLQRFGIVAAPVGVDAGPEEILAEGKRAIQDYGENERQRPDNHAAGLTVGIGKRIRRATLPGNRASALNADRHIGAQDTICRPDCPEATLRYTNLRFR